MRAFMESSQTEIVGLPPCNWLMEAYIYNKRNKQVPSKWIVDNADVIALLFTSYGVDKGDILAKFYEIYEQVKFLNVPLEVIFVPMDETERESRKCYKIQANWFTLRFADPLIPLLKYMYEVTCMPHLLLLKTDGTIVSTHGIVDLEEYGKNAVITWLSTSASLMKHRKIGKEMSIYGPKWRYLGVTDKERQDGKKWNVEQLEDDLDETIEEF